MSKESLDLGLVPFSQTASHPIMSGTACTTEMVFVFEGPRSRDGATRALSLIRPVTFTNVGQFCDSGAIRGFRLPHRPGSTVFYDEWLDRFWMPIIAMGFVEPHLMVHLMPSPRRYNIAG